MSPLSCIITLQKPGSCTKSLVIAFTIILIPKLGDFRLSSQDVKTLLLLDNALSHSNIEKVCNHEGKIKCLALPPNTTLVVQTTDQGIIVACKRLYRRRLLDEVMVVLQQPEAKLEDTRWKRALDNIRSYTIKSAIFNWASAWQGTKKTSLANGWKKLLFDRDVDLNLERLEPTDFQKTILVAGETGATEDVAEWLDVDEREPGCQIMTAEEIVQDVSAAAYEKQDSKKEKEEETTDTHNLSKVRDALDKVVNFISVTANKEMQPYCQHLKTLRETVIHKQQQKFTQLKMDMFLKTVSASELISLGRTRSSTEPPQKVSESDSE
jgi:hypothetical protein